MRQLTSEESKVLLLDILINVADFCDKHNLEYSIGYGTLIGAIRHKGFIPWDDDIDIIMMRDDYERFIAIYRDNRYKIISGENQANHLHIRVSDSKTQIKYTRETAQSKIYNAGLWIDIFPVDKVPDNPKQFNKISKKIKKLSWYRFFGDFGGKSLKLKMAHFIFKPFSKLLGNVIYHTMVKGNSMNTHTVANLAVYYLNFPQFPLIFMDEFVDVEFEGHTFKAISRYDTWLRGIYGDYMQYPPEDKRIAHHYYDAYIME